MKLLTTLLLGTLALNAQAFYKDYNCKCGQKSVARIVGGTQASVGEWPWQAGLVVGSSLFCGGSLINDRYVLTSAHCVKDRKLGDFDVWLSDHILSSSTDTSKVVRSVNEIIVHENYSPDNEISNIALLRLSSPVTITSNLLPVCLPPVSPTYANQQATVTGWGLTTSSSTTMSDVLREVTIPVLSNTACRAFAVYGTAITDNTLCAGSTGINSCHGDYGGPLVIKDGGNSYDQIGVMSWGIGCGKNGNPGVYTRVNKYLTWIDANTLDGIYCAGF